MKTQTRAQQLADAFMLIAEANHYMVGLVDTPRVAELDAAEQILISKQNNAHTKYAQRLLGTALDILEESRKRVAHG